SVQEICRSLGIDNGLSVYHTLRDLSNRGVVRTFVIGETIYYALREGAKSEQTIADTIENASPPAQSDALHEPIDQKHKREECQLDLVSEQKNRAAGRRGLANSGDKSDHPTSIVRSGSPELGDDSEDFSGEEYFDPSNKSHSDHAIDRIIRQ